METISNVMSPLVVRAMSQIPFLFELFMYVIMHVYA